MTVAAEPLPARQVLRNASSELEELGTLVLSLERLVSDLASSEPRIVLERGRELQAFDLLAQRLRGLAACLAAAAGHLPEGAALPAGALTAALPLAQQRRALLQAPGPGGATSADGGRLELF